MVWVSTGDQGGNGQRWLMRSYLQRPAPRPKLPRGEESLCDGLGVRIVEEFVGPFVDGGKRTELAFAGCFLSNVWRWGDTRRSSLDRDSLVSGHCFSMNDDLTLGYRTNRLMELTDVLNRQRMGTMNAGLHKHRTRVGEEQSQER